MAGGAPAATVLVVGLGDLGGRIFELLAASPRIDTLLGCGRSTPGNLAVVAQAALIAETLGGPAHVDHLTVELNDRAGLTRLLEQLTPDLVVFTASRHSWWRTPPAAAGVPYGIWLPLQLSLLRTFMAAHRDAQVSAPVVALPHPDAAGPVLAAEGLAPHTGAGNVAEVAAKLRLLIAQEHRCHRDDVQVRLVLHHAAERLAFELFAALGGLDPYRGDSTGRPAAAPYLAHVTVGDVLLPAAEVDRLLRRTYPLPGGTASHQLTAVTAARLVDALLDDHPQRLHVPAPAGLPGGYPVQVSRHGIELDLPDTITLQQARAVNEHAAAHDGIRAIDPDGTIHLTQQASQAAQAVLGLTLQDIPLTALDDVAEQLDRALKPPQ